MLPAWNSSSGSRRGRGARWRTGARRLSGGAAVLPADYANHPRVELSPDSHEFIARAAAILAGGPLVDPIRLPGYPLVIALVWRPRLAAEGSGDTRRERATLVGLVALVGLYGLVITTLGGYGDYARLHTAFAPLMLVVQWGGALGALASVTKRR